MAKEKGKNIKRKGKKIGQPNAKIKNVKVCKISQTENIATAPARHTYSTEGSALPGSNSNGGASRCKEKEKAKRLSGFIFMCNSITKLKCYQYRVFGLPMGKKGVVEEIKPGAKLFLFDFELKLLYGIYEATSAGNLNLEPAAFGGSFPAQVKFKIFKECLPLPESSLRHVIKENYTGSKFKQELSAIQVRKLLSSFRPLAASLSQPASQALANVSLSRAMPLYREKPPVMEVPYFAEMLCSHIRPLAESQPVPKVDYLQQGCNRTAAYVEHVRPTLDHRTLPATGSYNVANSQQPPFTEGVTLGVQQLPYSRCMAMEQRAPHDKVTVSEMQYHHQSTLQRESHLQDNVAACNSNLAATTQYPSSIMPAQVPAPYHELPLQRAAQHQDSVVAYSPNHVAQAQYTASVLQPQVQAQYISLATQPQVLAYDRITSYCSYSTADRCSYRS